MSHKPSVSRLIAEHGALKRAGVTSFVVRQRMIMLAHLRATDFEAWVRARADLSVFDVIEADGEAMVNRLTENSTFRRDEITLPKAAQMKQGRAVQ